jgi:hypothetical protein
LLLRQNVAFAEEYCKPSDRELKNFPTGQTLPTKPSKNHDLLAWSPEPAVECRELDLSQWIEDGLKAYQAVARSVLVIRRLNVNTSGAAVAGGMAKSEEALSCDETIVARSWNPSTNTLRARSCRVSLGDKVCREPLDPPASRVSPRYASMQGLHWGGMHAGTPWGRNHRGIPLGPPTYKVSLQNA